MGTCKWLQCNRRINLFNIAHGWSDCYWQKNPEPQDKFIIWNIEQLSWGEKQVDIFYDSTTACDDFSHTHS